MESSAMDAVALEQRVYRRSFHLWAFALGYVLAAGFLVLLATLSTPYLALAALPFLWLSWRTIRVGVYVASSGVSVRNVFRSHFVPWADVDRFGMGLWGASRIGGLYRSDGSFVRSFALNPPFEMTADEDAAVPRALADLNAELERARAPLPHPSR